MDYGIKVSEDGVDVLTAEAAQLLLSIEYPHAKLDTQNSVSFQNITLTFLNNPPEPSGVFPDIYRTTTVHRFEHGYDYIPSVWALCQVLTPPSATAFYQDYFQDAGTIGSKTFSDAADFFVVADATNIYFKVRKLYQGGPDTNDITGARIKVRPYVFVEGVS